MSALAELFVKRGYSVTGCDATLATADDLRKLGIELFEGHDPSHVSGVREVVVTSAVRRDHPELVRARELGIPVIRRAEALGRAVSGGELVAVAGTHGKTTTTVMTTEALRSAGLDPTGLAGGRVGAWNGNLISGADKVFVVEADEYDRSFHALSPTIAVVTNIEEDHLDIYPGGIGEIREAFAQFARGAKFIVLCGDDPGSSTLPVPSSAEVIRYGIESSDARLLGSEIESRNGGSAFSVRYDDEELGTVSLRVPGMHNIRNALAAIAAGLALGVTLDGMRGGLEAFTGVERRFQLLGDVAGVTIVDDYAHHPTEIEATLQAARAAFPEHRIIVAFQPHLYSRTRDFHHAFANVLGLADVVYLADLYPAREQPIAGVSAKLISHSMVENGRGPDWEGPRSELAQAIATSARKGDVVLTVGAGDITRTGPELRELLANK
jgi:UDP-N-acetylmuramate--alanine ligase